MDLAYTLNASVVNSSGSDFLKNSPEVAITYTFFLVVATFMGTTGNIFVITTVVYIKKLRTIENCFIINLAIADLCVSGFVDPFSVVGVLYGNSFFETKPFLCEMVASICLTSCFCSLLSIGAISFNRFIHICHRKYYSRIYTNRSCVAIAIGLWLVSFLLEMPNFIGWGDHVFDNKTRSCVWDRTANFSYTLFFVLVGVVLPLIVISVCYVKIFIFVRIAKQRISNYTGVNTENSRKERGESIRLAKMLFIVFAVFTICWSPYALVVVLDVDDTFPQALHAFVLLVAHTNSSLNCVIYGVFNKAFRKGYTDLFLLLSCRKRTSASDSVTRQTIKSSHSGNTNHTIQVPTVSVKSEVQAVSTINLPEQPTN